MNVHFLDRTFDVTVFNPQRLREHKAKVRLWSCLSFRNLRSRLSEVRRSGSLLRALFSPKWPTQRPDPTHRTCPSTAAQHPSPRHAARMPAVQAPEGDSYHPQELPFLFGFITCKQNKCHVTAAVYLYSFQVSFWTCLLRNSTKDVFSLHLWKYWQQWHRRAPRYHGCSVNKSLFIGLDLNKGGDLKREKLQALVTANCWPDSRPERCNQGPGLPGIWQSQGCKRGWCALPQPPPPGGMPALLAAGGSGLRLLGRSQSRIFGECFTLGNRPGIMKERPPPSPAKVSFSCFRKEVPRKERQHSRSLSLYRCSLHSPETAHREPVRRPWWIAKSPQHWSGGSKCRGLRWTDCAPHSFGKKEPLRASPQNSGTVVRLSPGRQGGRCYVTERGLLHPGIKRGRSGDPWSGRARAHNETFVRALQKAVPETHTSLYFSVIVGLFLIIENLTD